jgi:diguanylate cyclase (GGDEF)-like protein
MISPSVDALWIAASALTVASVALTLFGLRQRHYRGYAWWLGALWLTTAGVAAAAASREVFVQSLAALLWVQWPIVTLIGLRRFHARLTLPASERTDWLVLALAGTAAASGPLWPADGTLGQALPAAAFVAAHLYAACLMFCVPDRSAGLLLSLLGLTMTAVALAPGVLSWPGSDVLGPLQARAVATALGAVVMAFVVITLVCERTERQLRDSRRRLRVLANIDSLTNVPNRRHFRELATLALRADAPGTAALLMFDIDHFKQLNDRHGHATGDRALRAVSRSMSEHLRALDIAGRQGGDEFVLMLRNTSVRDALGVASRMVAHLQSQARDVHLPQLTLSFGVVQMIPGEPLDEALRRADQALYEAKRQGRSCAVAAGGDERRPVFVESRRLGLTAA